MNSRFKYSVLETSFFMLWQGSSKYHVIASHVLIGCRDVSPRSGILALGLLMRSPKDYGNMDLCNCIQAGRATSSVGRSSPANVTPQA